MPIILKKAPEGALHGDTSLFCVIFKGVDV